MLTVRSSIKFWKQFWQTLGYYNYHFPKEIRKSMNFKQDSEREIKRRKGWGGRHGKRLRFNWCAAPEPGATRIFPRRFEMNFTCCALPFQTAGTISIFTAR